MAVDPAAVNNLAGLLTSPRFRRSFEADPEAALERAGVSVDAVSPELVDALSDLSGEELRTVADLNARVGPALEGAAEFTGGVIF